MNGHAISDHGNSLSNMRVLLVDDDAIARRVLETFRKSSGCHIESARNGRTAISKSKEQLFRAIVEAMPILPAYQRSAAQAGMGTVTTVDPELIPLLPSFVKEMKQIVGSMREVMGQMDVASVRASARKLAGAGGSRGLDAISTGGRLIESAAEATNHSDVRTLMDELDSYLNDVEAHDA